MNKTLDGLKDMSFEDGLRELDLTVDMIMDMKKHFRHQQLGAVGIVVDKVPAKEAFDVFENACKHHQLRKVHATSSYYVYQQVIREFRNFCMETIGREMQVQDIPKFYDDFLIKKSCAETSFKDSTYNKYVAILRTFLRFLEKHYKFELVYLPLFRDDENTLPQYFPGEEIPRLFDIARQSNLGVRNQFLVSFSLSTGLRRNEFRHVQLRDVSLDECKIRVTHAKGGGERTVPFARALCTVINRYVEYYDIKKPTDFLFGKVGDPQKCVSNQNIDQVVHALVSKLPSYEQGHRSFGYRCHTFRHTYAVSLLNAGVPLRVIKDLLGHGSLRSTETYTRLGTEDLRRAATPGFDGISNLLEGLIL